MTYGVALGSSDISKVSERYYIYENEKDAHASTTTSLWVVSRKQIEVDRDKFP